MHGPLPPNRSGGTTGQPNLAPPHFGLADDSRGKAGKKTPSSRGRSSIPPPYPVSPAPRVVAASTDATVLLVEVPRYLEGRWGGPRHIDRK
jgi:hypothetical protein